jgi:hypothetical protein
VYANECTPQLWKQFCWWFISRQWLSFPWLLISQQGLCSLMNSGITCGIVFYDDFWADNYSVSVDYFWVNWCCVRWRIHASLVEAVSLTIFESTGAVCADESMSHLQKQFCWWFLSLQQLSFRSFLVNWSFVHWWIQASPVEAVSLMISESIGAVYAVKSTCHLSKRIHWWFWIGSYSIFLDYFWVNMGCVW